MDDIVLMVLWGMLFISLCSVLFMGWHVTKKARGS